MKRLYLKMGEHLLHIQSEWEYIIEQVAKDYFPFIQTINQMEPAIEIWLEPGSGVPTMDFHVDITKTPASICYERSDYRLEVNVEYNRATISALNSLALKHAISNLYSAYIVHHSWGLLIHSSCIEHVGKAYLFAGQSGAGKSTVARLSTPRPILSDEATIVKIHSDSIQVLPSPFHSEIKATNSISSCQLSAIYLLVQSQDMKTTELKKTDALMNIIDKVFYWPHDQVETKKALQLCQQLINQVPTYAMYFQKNNRFWELIS